jgi:2-phospho-L-lactate guanylyltransferase
MAQALLPLKDLVQAKTRLGGLLRPSERRALAQAMAEDVLAVLAGHADVSRITLVSDDPCADLLARKYGADCWSERALACSGLNNLMHCASERLLANGTEPLLVLHCDLPLLAHEDITAVLSSLQECDGLIIGCDRQVTGTNLLAFADGAMPRFSFGPGSCAAHMADAESEGIRVRILQRLGIMVDVDEPSDLAYLMDCGMMSPNSHTAALLCATGLGARIAFALSAMVDSAGMRNSAVKSGLIDRGSFS